MRLAVYLAAILVGLPSMAAAQRDAFRDELIAFHSKLAGEYGDEAPVIINSLEAMASSLSTWDAAIRAAQEESRRRLLAATVTDRIGLHSRLAELYLERGRYADAIRELDAAIQTDGSRATVHVLRGLALEASGRPQDAVVAFRRAWEIDNDDPVNAYLLASRRSTQAGSDEISPEAVSLLKALDRRLTSVPGDRSVPLFPEFALVPDGAAVTPVFSPARYANGFTLLIAGRYEEAIVTFKRAIAGDPLVAGTSTVSERAQQAIAQLRNGNAESAIPLLETAAAASPRSSEIQRILGGAYADAGNDAKSIEHFETAVALAPDDERASVSLGRELAYAGQLDRAERVLQATIARLPNSADAHSALADAYETTRGRDALHELEIAAALPVLAGKGALYFRLADLQHRHLEYEQVIAPLTQRVRLNPNHARAHTDLGLAFARVGRSSDALVELVTASLIGPDDAEALTAIGQIQFDAGMYAAAETVLRRGVAAAPALLQARYLMGQTLARLGRAQEAAVQLAEFDRLRAAVHAETRRTFEIDQLRQQAERATNAGRREEAVTAWQEVVDREPKRPEDRVALARALLAADKRAAAVEQLQAAAALDANAEVYRELADIYAKVGRTTESAAARQMYKRLVQERRRGSER